MDAFQHRSNDKEAPKAGSGGDTADFRPTKIPSRYRLQPEMIAHEAGRILETGQNILARQGGILFQDILNGITRAQKFEDRLDRNARSTDDGASVTNSRVDGDPLVHPSKIPSLAQEASSGEIPRKIPSSGFAILATTYSRTSPSLYPNLSTI